MAQVYLIARRAEVQNGSVMVTDLFPSESQRNTAIDPVGAGPIYVRQCDVGLKGKYRSILTTVGGQIHFLREARGLVAFLLRNVRSGANNDALTLAEATKGANDLMELVRDGGALTVAEVNKILVDNDIGGAGTDITTDSTIEALLRVIAGETYIVKAGSVIDDGVAFVPDLNAIAGFQNDVRHPIDGDSSWAISAEEGVLAGLKSARDEKVGFAGVLSTDPIVTIHNSDGSLYV